MAKKTVAKGGQKQKERVQIIRSIKNPQKGSYFFRTEMVDKENLDQALKSGK